MATKFMYMLELILLCILGLVCFTNTASLKSADIVSEKEQIRRREAGVPPNTTSSVTTAQTTPLTTPPVTGFVKCVDGKNGSNCHPNSTDEGTSWTSKFPKWMDKNKGILERTMYVLAVLTVIVVLYFVIKMVRLRRKKSKTRRYGVLSTGGDNLEMTPLDQDDDEDDMTVFEVNGHRK